MISLETSSACCAYASSMSSFDSVTSVKGVKKDDGENSGTKLLGSSQKSDEINDEAIISDKANSLFESEQAEKDKKNEDNKQGEELTKEQQVEISKLKARDAEVRSHEQAHLAAAAGINASAPSFSYQSGPDGRRYAIGGEVSISFSETENPKENLAKAQVMKAAALAPAEPSSQDYSVARSADALIAKAHDEISAQQQEKMAENKDSDGDNNTKINSQTSDNDKDKDDKPLLVRT